MSYKENVPNRMVFWVKLKEDLLSGEELCFEFFIQMSLKFSANCDLVLQTNVWKNENHNCGFSNDAIFLKCDL